jgi:hypothetical protein
MFSEDIPGVVDEILVILSGYRSNDRKSENFQFWPECSFCPRDHPELNCHHEAPDWPKSVV